MAIIYDADGIIRDEKAGASPAQETNSEKEQTKPLEELSVPLLRGGR